MDFSTSWLDAEQAVLSAMLMPGVAAAHIAELTPEDFGTDDHRRIYTAIQALHIQRQEISEITIADELTRHFGSDMPTMLALIEARRKYAFNRAFMLTEHIAIVRRQSIRRRAHGVLTESAAMLDDATVATADVLDRVRRALRDIEGAGQTETSALSDVLIAAYGELESRVRGENRGFPYGISTLDAKTAGLHRGELTLIGARPSVGKSAMALQIALSAAQSGAKVLICSREMTAEQYGIRVLMRGTTIPSAKLRAGDIDDDAWAQLGDALQHYGRLDTIAFTFSHKYVEDLRRAVEEQREHGGLDVLIVDYLQLLQTRQRCEKDYQRIGAVSKALKDMSVDYNIAVVALAQVGRSAGGDMPSLSELRGSGDLEQDADNVIFMHRPASAADRCVRRDHAQLFDGLAMLGQQYLVLDIAKQRQGVTGQFAITFDPQTMHLTPIPRSAPPNCPAPVAT